MDSGLLFTGDHSYVTLRSISDIIQSKYDEKLKACSDQITKLCKLEKEAWHNIDQFNNDCDEMVTKVNQAVKKQVCLLSSRLGLCSLRIIYKIHRIVMLDVTLAFLIEKK